MNRAGLLLLLSFVLMGVFNSCQKEEYNTHVELLVDKPVSTSSTAWTISGRILSSGKLDLTDHGFQVVIGDSSALIPLGAISKGGKVQTIVEGDPGDIISSVMLYAVDKKGNTYVSESLGEPVQITVPYHYSDGVGERFNTSAFISDVSKYAITEYGIEYRAQGATTAWLGYPAMVNYYNTQTVPIDIQIPYNIGLFIPSEIYEYRVYVKYYDLVNGTSGNTVYSPTDQFVASSPA